MTRQQQERAVRQYRRQSPPVGADQDVHVFLDGTCGVLARGAHRRVAQQTLQNGIKIARATGTLPYEGECTYRAMP